MDTVRSAAADLALSDDERIGASSESLPADVLSACSRSATATTSDDDASGGYVREYDSEEDHLAREFRLQGNHTDCEAPTTPTTGPATTPAFRHVDQISTADDMVSDNASAAAADDMDSDIATSATHLSQEFTVCKKFGDEPDWSFYSSGHHGNSWRAIPETTEKTGVPTKPVSLCKAAGITGVDWHTAQQRYDKLGTDC